jgi:hypothetical protein
MPAHNADLAGFFAFDQMRHVQVAIMGDPPVVMIGVEHSFKLSEIERQGKIEQRASSSKLARASHGVVVRPSLALKEGDDRF